MIEVEETRSPMDALELPLTISGLRPAWLTEALSILHPGIEVRSATVGTVHYGTATRARLLLDYDERGHAARLPATLWVKGAFDGPNLGVMAEGYAREVRFYRDLAPALGLCLPRCYFAGIDRRRNGQSLVLLEDLLARNVRIGSALGSLPLETAAELVDQLARLHARWWGSPELARLGWLRPAQWITREGLTVYLTPEVWAACLERRGRRTRGALRDLERVRRGMELVAQAQATMPPTLIHGDTHVGNVFIEPGGAAGFLDWQIVSVGSFAHDLSYLLVTALDGPTRRARERELIARYLERLGSLGAKAPSFEEAWLAYRRHAFYTFGWTVCPAEMQPEPLCVANAERAAEAVTDLESLAALDSLA